MAGALMLLGLALALAAPLGLIEERRLAQWFVTAFGASVLAAGLGLAWAGAALALALFALFLGTAAQLYVTEPLWYNALRLPPRTSVNLVMYLLIGLQLGIATGLLAAKVPPRAWTAGLRQLGAWRLALFALLSIGFSVSPLNFLRTGTLPDYALQLAAYAVLFAVNAATVMAICASLPARAAGLRQALPVPVLALYAFAASACLAWFGFEATGHVADEVSYIFQARTYAGGALWVPALPPGAQPAFEHFQLAFENGRWFSPLAPGWPAVLALGVLAGAPWLVNPLLGAGAVALAYALLARRLAPQSAWTATLLLATSPWLIALSATFMTHALSLFLVLLAWWLLALSAEAETPRKSLLALAAGLALGWLFLTRQLDGIAAGLFTGLWLLAQARRHGLAARVLPFAVGGTAAGGLIFPYNALMTGDPLTPAMARYFERTWNLEGFENRIGFGPAIGPPGGFGEMELITPGHTPYEAVINTLNNINSLHTDLFGWAAGSLALVWAFLIWGRKSRFDVLMLAFAALVAGAYFFYWFAGSYYAGPRYWYLAIFPLVFLSARGLESLARPLQAAGMQAAAARLGGCAVLLCLCASLVFLTYRGTTRYHHFRGYHGHFRDLVLPPADNGYAPLVLFRGDIGNEASAYFLNDPYLAPARPVFAEDLGPGRREAVIRAFPNRQVIYVERADLGLP
ncbi:hypothetical protein ACUXV3_19960 (plasmid) [Roseobacteraceae bacterium NS-SX3]